MEKIYSSLVACVYAAGFSTTGYGWRGVAENRGRSGSIRAGMEGDRRGGGGASTRAARAVGSEARNGGGGNGTL